MNDSLLIRISNLQNNMGLLTHSLHQGIKPTVQYQLERVWICVKELSQDSVEKKVWRNLHQAQELFIDPEAVHACMKLQSAVATYIQAIYLNDEVRTHSAIAQIKDYLEFIADQYNINHELIIKY